MHRVPHSQRWNGRDEIQSEPKLSLSEAVQPAQGCRSKCLISYGPSVQTSAAEHVPELLHQLDTGLTNERAFLKVA